MDKDRKRRCNKCMRKDEKAANLKKRGLAGHDTAGRPLVRCAGCGETYRFEGRKTREEALSFRCKGCKKKPHLSNDVHVATEGSGMNAGKADSVIGGDK